VRNRSSREYHHIISLFTSSLQTLLSKISTRQTPCVLAGDINLSLLNVDSHAATANYLNTLLLHNFKPVILFPTRITPKSATLIDHIFYYEGGFTKKVLKLYSGNILSDTSDHLPNFFILCSSTYREDINSRPFIRLFTPDNKRKFSDILQTIDWASMYHNITDVNVCVNKLLTILQTALDYSFPLVRQSRRAFKDKQWITPGIKASSKRKDILYRNWQLSKNLTDEIAYRSYKKVYSAIVKKYQIAYYNKLFDSSNNSIKKRDLI